MRAVLGVISASGGCAGVVLVILKLFFQESKVEGSYKKY